ncbi:MAG TPA: TraR/DksA family transcriptional regulator [Ktedonobacterales bacterium]|jgi:DnaK suppressor protein
MTEANQAPTLPIDALRQRLIDEMRRLEHELYQLTRGDEAVSATEPTLERDGMAGDQADDASVLSQAERNRAIIAHTQQLLSQVNEALARIDAGTYGKCTHCERPIQPARLQAIPSVALCMDCQTKSELAQNRGGRPQA